MHDGAANAKDVNRGEEYAWCKIASMKMPETLQFSLALLPAG